MKYIKLFELFDINITYEYEYMGIDKSKILIFDDHIGYIYKYKFTSSLDGTKYYVKILHDTNDRFMTVSFSDKNQNPYISIMNNLFKNSTKDEFTNKNEPLNILNTVIKICRDFYNDKSDEIDYFGISAYTKKRINVYLYIIKKYFKGWSYEIKEKDLDLYSITLNKEELNEYYTKYEPSSSQKPLVWYYVILTQDIVDDNEYATIRGNGLRFLCRDYDGVQRYENLYPVGGEYNGSKILEIDVDVER